MLDQLAPLADPDQAAVVNAILARHAGHHLGRRLDGARIGPARRSRQPQDRAQAYRAAQEDPLVKALMSAFDAEIIAREPSDRAQWLQRRQADAGDAGDVTADNGYH
ncbi:MAG: hypothetical protein ACOCYP_07290 [Planctomycetota bacterium]